MSSGGRGRGYTGRHSRARPGERVEEPRTLPEPSPRAAVPAAAASPPAERCEMSRARRSPAHSISESDLLDNISAEDDAVLKELLHVDDQFQPLLLLLEQFSPSEDGIQFNRKLRNFETTITNMCPDEARLQAAFASFRAAALLSPGAARRLAGVGASFTRQQRQQVLRSTLLNVVLQGTFAKLDILERANPLFLINAANLMGDYFSEARLCNGNKVHILASPLLQYMKALLASDDVRAHRSLATQLMQNGRELLSVSPSETEESILVHCPQLMQNGRELLSVSPAETEELGVRLRLRLLGALAPGAALWLLLAADMALNRFLPLPAALQHFYAQHLQLGAPDKPAYCEVGYGAWRRADTEPAPEDESKPRLRPILGAGAALKPADAEWRAARRREPGAWRPEDEEPAFDPSVLPPPLPRAYDYPPPTYDYNNYLQQGDGHYIRNQPYKEELALAELSVADGQPPDPSDPDDIPERATIADFEGPERTRVPDNDKLTDKVNNEIQKSRARPTENWRSGDEERPPRRTMRRGAEPEPEAEPEREPRRTAPDVPRHHKYWDHDDRCDKEY